MTNFIPCLTRFVIFSDTFKLTKAIGRSAAVGGIIELGISIHDIHRFYQLMKDGNIDNKRFMDLVIERLVIAFTSVAGSQLGTVAGFYVAGPAGYVIRGILGMLGNMLGRKFGRVVSGDVVVFGKQVVNFLEKWKKQAAVDCQDKVLVSLQ